MKEIREIIGYASHLRGYFFAIAIAGVIGALINFATPFITKLATDFIVEVVSGKRAFDVMPIIWFVVAQLGVTIVTVLATDIGGWFGDVMSIRVRHQLSKRYFEKLLKLPQRYYDGEVTGKIVNRLTRAVTDITQFLQFFSNNLLSLLLTIGITIIVLFVYSWPLAILFVLLIPANLYLTARTSGKWQKLEKEKNSLFDAASGRFNEAIGQSRLVKSYVTEPRELRIFTGNIEGMISLTRDQSRYWHSMNALRGIVFGSIFAAIYGILFYQTAKGQLTVGDMVMLITLVTQVSFPLRNLSFFVDSYQRAVANSRDYLAAMKEEPEVEDSKKTLSIKNATVVYKNVSFSYESSQKVLDDISFELKSGTKLALVGESGGGKSTISNLLMRLYDPDMGKITIDGVDISTVSRMSVRKNIATVFQDAALFSGTIRENIAYARPNASTKEVEKAARAANAWKFIDKFPDGLDTEIGERGIKLSGGQKQRISIARAILKDAPILILDEATSALDSRAEAEVQQALERLMKGRTTLIIAHRLSTIAHVDTIVTIEDGKVHEIGTPDELAKTDGIYAQLLALQLGDSERAKKQLKKYDIALD
ncbi:ABC transporter ATP-binding protein [Candidatus Nomurabacteria bacterium]|nr:ABC transporter ATP-binding protein [Candidatus Nomurabacteria bacterium]